MRLLTPLLRLKSLRLRVRGTGSLSLLTYVHLYISARTKIASYRERVEVRTKDGGYLPRKRIGVLIVDGNRYRSLNAPRAFPSTSRDASQPQRKSRARAASSYTMRYARVRGTTLSIKLKYQAAAARPTHRHVMYVYAEEEKRAAHSPQTTRRYGSTIVRGSEVNHKLQRSRWLPQPLSAISRNSRTPALCVTRR